MAMFDEVTAVALPLLAATWISLAAALLALGFTGRLGRRQLVTDRDG